MSCPPFEASGAVGRHLRVVAYPLVPGVACLAIAAFGWLPDRSFRGPQALRVPILLGCAAVLLASAVVLAIRVLRLRRPLYRLTTEGVSDLLEQERFVGWPEVARVFPVDPATSPSSTLVVERVAGKGPDIVIQWRATDRNASEFLRAARDLTQAGGHDGVEIVTSLGPGERWLEKTFDRLAVQPPTAGETPSRRQRPS